MRKIHLLALGVALMILLATAVSAEEEGGILSKILSTIIKLIKTIISIFTGSEATTTTTTSTTTQPSLCSPPYIQVGRECCLDSNGNGICDSDEVTTTTTKPTTTTTRATTTTSKPTTTPQTTTTQPSIECYEQSDCGTSVTKRECYTDGDIYWFTWNPICKNAGTPEAYCYTRMSGISISGNIHAEKAEDCPGLCDTETDTCLS